eukprot:TRINITY_DN96323_c0_g1_i1.p1 TRINITY_DN96323_c0_g1~~TRINITY_DN96323_c0_g1_i1.p1  ORF type:complete len:311 (-),score=40.87 TRINITY_DN96323_c0_g1_i1:61-993(-)
MRRTRSDTQIFNTRRSAIGDHIGNAVPGYMGYVPGARLEVENSAATHKRSIELAKESRSHRTWDAQAHRLGREHADRRARSTVPPTLLPTYDNRGISYPAAGDTHHSRVASSTEEKVHFHSSMGLSSLTHDNLGGAGDLKGYGAAARGIPGYKGFVPGKVAENVHAEVWSKCHEKSLKSHFESRGRAPKVYSLVTEGRTTIAPVKADTLAEVPIRNPSYHDHARGWSDCAFTGKHIDSAGRLPPHGRQEGFGGIQPPVNQMGMHGIIPIHGYAGCVPGRVGENVVGERQCKTNAIADQLFRKNCMRNTQR